jgi:hypothetical protein
MAKDKNKKEGVDLSTSAELWTEEELRELIREEALKLLGQFKPPVVAPSVVPYPNPNTYPQYPGQWQQTTGNNNMYHDGHTVNCSSNVLVGSPC